MNKITLSLIFLIIISTLSLTAAAEVDTKMKVEICELAIANVQIDDWEFSGGSGVESDIFKPWNEASQTGTFMLINNTNRILGESSLYEFTRYNANNTWFNEFENVGPESDIPIIKVGGGINKWIYTRCKFTVGDYRIFLFLYRIGGYNYLTSDFNLTIGAEPPITANKSTAPWISKASSYIDSFSSGTGSLNNLNPGETGLFQNTEPYAIYRIGNLATIPTSYLRFSMSQIMVESGNEYLVSSPEPRSIIYINNSDINIDVSQLKKVTAQSSQIIKRDETTGQTFTGGGGEFKLLAGHNYSITVPFKNTYGVPLNMTFLDYGISISGWWGYGICEGSETVNLAPSQPSTGISNISFLPGETINITTSYKIPEDETGAMPRATQQIRWYNTNDPFKEERSNWLALASEEFPYLGFRAIDPRIEMKLIDEKFEPVFSINQSLYVGGYTHNLAVSPNDYELETRIYKDIVNSSNIVFSTTNIIDYALAKSSITPFIITIPIDYDWGEGKFYVMSLAKMINAISPRTDFQGQYISKSDEKVYFLPGDIAYQYGNQLRFAENARIDSEKIAIFNPSFYENDFDITIENISDQENFSLSWDGTNFNNANKTIHLYPLQTKEITFWVNATYNPWVSSSRTENMAIKTYSMLKTELGTIEKTNILSFTLNVYEDLTKWFNLKPIDFSVSNQIGSSTNVVYLDNINQTKTKKITLTWDAIGSESEIANITGKTYKVDVSLLNKTSGTIIFQKTVSYIISETGIVKLEFEYPFTYGNYSLVINLDSTNQIDEKDSWEESAEEDNKITYNLPVVVTYCEYNTTDHYLYTLDFFGNKIIDTNNICECPANLMLILNTGYCADPYGKDCPTFDTYIECNDLTITNQSICGWESNTSGITDPGYCLSCSEIQNTCGAYNNEETCDDDPCQKAAIYDCSPLECDINENLECFWEGNECKINITKRTGLPCEYKIDIIQDCLNPTSKKMIINYTTTDPGCENAIKETLCEQRVVPLNFFSKISLILAILTISLFYLIRKEKFSKNPKPSKRAIK